MSAAELRRQYRAARHIARRDEIRFQADNDAKTTGPCWYHFDALYSPASGRWPLRVSCCATGPLAAVRKMRRAFPPEPGTRLVALAWNPYAPCIRPTDD